MNSTRPRGRRGFTLVELMTAIAIIVLLAGILIPAIQTARMQAKKAATAGLLRAVDTGCEAFKSDFGFYPQSRGENPFEPAGDNIYLMGAQWLGLQLVGADTRGYVEPTIKNNANPDDDKVINELDWLDWYSLNPARDYTRKHPYVDTDPKSLRTPEQFFNTYPDQNRIPRQLMGSRWPYSDGGSGEGGSSDWDNGRIPFFVDAFGYPVIYYRANLRVDAPFTTGIPGGEFVVGRYDQSDNMYYTGTDGNNGRYVDEACFGWDLSGALKPHSLAVFGWDPGDHPGGPSDWPEAGTFAEFVADWDVYQSTGGRVWPYRPDSFLLIAPGQDGMYGTGDDVTNFRKGE